MVLPTSPQPDEQFCELIQARTGLILNVHQRADVAVILNNLVADEAMPAEDLLALLSQSPSSHPFWRRIIHIVTVGETYFFRNMAQFDALRLSVLPALIEERRKSGSKQLRLWSAGSSTGEEAYSLAILLCQMLPDIESWRITILATDINEDYLEQARVGLYRQRSFRTETPADLREYWFNAEKEGHRLRDSIRNMVDFRWLNLVSDDYPSYDTNTMYMDIIVCRNVTIYFDRETTRGIVTRFHKTLSQNGWLVVGHAEPQSELYKGFGTRNFKDTVFYQKLNAENPPSQVSLGTSPATQPTKPPTRRIEKVASIVPTIKKSAVKPSPAAAAAEDFWEQAKHAADGGRWHEAQQWLNKAEQKNKFRPEVHYLRALIELHHGNTAQAVDLLRKAIYCDMRFALAHYALGNLYAQQQARKEAARHWKLALEAVENLEAKMIVPYSEDITVEMLVTELAARLAG